MNFSTLWGWKVRGWNVLTLVAFNSRLFNPDFWKVRGWKESGDEKSEVEMSGYEKSRVEKYGGEMSCNHRTHNPTDMTNHFHLKCKLKQGQLQIWTEHSHCALNFENLKPVEKSKNHLNIIWTSSKVVLIFKIWRVRLKNYNAYPRISTTIFYLIWILRVFYFSS